MSTDCHQPSAVLRTAEESGDRIRIYDGPAGIAVSLFLVGFALFQIFADLTGMLGAVKLRAAHILFLLPLTFLLYPARRGEPRRRSCPPAADLILCAAAVFCFAYILRRYDAFSRTGRLSDADVVTGLVCLLLCFEAARRAGGTLAVIAFLFFSYFAIWGRFLPGLFGTAAFSPKRVVKSLVWDTIGILGTGSGVSATYIFVFVLFGSFLKYSGFSQLINDLSLTLVGRSPGGPAKVSVLASALMGMINGSAVANVATTGTITIPLMKKTGYRSEFAAAVEAVASTGGQFTPPIMGAVGFVMAEFMAVPYTRVMLAAAIPAFLYYLGLLWSVHLEAKRLGLSGLSPENIPSVSGVLRTRGHLLIPLFLLLGLMFSGYTPLYAAILALFSTVPVSWLRKETRMSPRVILQAVLEGTRSSLGVGVCCVIIGVIIGSVNMTGLGVNFGNLILTVVGEGQLLLGGLMVMILSIVLGMGVPGVAAYVIVYAVAVPVLREVGATDMAANLFCLIYACLSNITPPVAMSSYVASGIAGSSTVRTSLLAIRLGITGFIVPFFFLDNPVLLFGSTQGVGAFTVLYAFITACAGVLALSGALSGLPSGLSLHGILRFIPGRILMASAGLLLIRPGMATDAAAAALLVLGLLARRILAPAR